MTSKITETKQAPKQLEQKIVATENVVKVAKIPDYKELFAAQEARDELFKDLAELYYHGQKFGTATKTDIDLIMFKHYFMQLRKRSGSDVNGYSDFLISQELGITEGRVSNLKVKTELRYQYLKDSWKEEFAKLLPNARVEDRKVKLYIPEKSIYLKIKNEIESKGEYVDIQLNGKLLQIPAKSFTAVIMGIVDDATYKSFKEGINRIQGFKEYAENSVREVMEKTKAEIYTKTALKFISAVAELAPVTESVINLGKEIKNWCMPKER